MGHGDIAKMPGLKTDAGFGLFSLRITQNKTVFRHMIIQPCIISFIAHCGDAAGIIDCKIKGKPAVMLAVSGNADIFFRILFPVITHIIIPNLLLLFLGAVGAVHHQIADTGRL